MKQSLKFGRYILCNAFQNGLFLVSTGSILWHLINVQIKRWDVTCYIRPKDFSLKMCLRRICDEICICEDPVVKGSSTFSALEEAGSCLWIWKEHQCDWNKENWHSNLKSFKSWCLLLG